jgi:penicillin-binding protein 1A
LFKLFMAEALKNRPAIPFRAPPGIIHVRINSETGTLARPGDRNVIQEVFKPGTEPTGENRVIDGGYAVGWSETAPGTGGGTVGGTPAVAGSGRGLY